MEYYHVNVAKLFILFTRIFGALTGPKILAGTAPIKVGSARLVLVDLVACFQFLSAAVSQQRLYKFVSEKHNSISVDMAKIDGHISFGVIFTSVDVFFRIF